MNARSRPSQFTEEPNPVAAQCMGKEPFASASLAQRVARARAKRFTKAHGMPERRTQRTPYRCPYCNQWHLGDPPRKPRIIGPDYRGPNW